MVIEKAKLKQRLAEIWNGAEAGDSIKLETSSHREQRLVRHPWPQGVSVTIGSRWQTKKSPILRGTMFAADVTENSVSLQLEETEDFRGGLASKLAWVSTAQDLAEKWECLPNDQILARRNSGPPQQ